MTRGPSDDFLDEFGRRVTDRRDLVMSLGRLEGEVTLLRALLEDTRKHLVHPVEVARLDHRVGRLEAVRDTVNKRFGFVIGLILLVVIMTGTGVLLTSGEYARQVALTTLTEVLRR
jgi:hypothetical protein